MPKGGGGGGGGSHGGGAHGGGSHGGGGKSCGGGEGHGGGGGGGKGSGHGGFSQVNAHSAMSDGPFSMQLLAMRTLPLQATFRSIGMEARRSTSPLNSLPGEKNPSRSHPMISC
ncbi:hypothetical protein PFISCL1PPCAC_10432 [Pristionchus fissidentatus]|uniref:Uncharacterized protein n=1 Tax=Pristionchus fissidentatus TaxID=1538716 RepID=A0AAV5VKJ6_9BILA|nr:hypothetical protein PFISCL1PPCAC_10432 [Pristionchus fissidentatus]